MHCMLSTGLYPEFQFSIAENSRPDEISAKQWTDYHPLHWTTVNILQNFSGASFEIITQDHNHVDDDALSMLCKQPQSKEDDESSKLVSKQHGMWIAELLENSWSDEVRAEMNAFKEETKSDMILLYCIFLCEYV